MIRWAAILLVALIALYGAPVAARRTCGLYTSIMAQLNLKYGESRLGFGLAGPQSAFEVWASEATGTWTILQVFPNGMACVRASGKGWQNDPPVAPGKPT